MHEIVKVHQRIWYDHQIALLRLDEETYDSLGYPEISGEIHKQIVELEKKRDEVLKCV